MTQRRTSSSQRSRGDQPRSAGGTSPQARPHKGGSRTEQPTRRKLSATTHRAIVKVLIPQGEHQAYGFVYLLDEQGVRTGEEVYFRWNDGSPVEYRADGSVYFTDVNNKGDHKRKPVVERPMAGDHIVCRVVVTQQRGKKALMWGFYDRELAEQAKGDH